MQGGAANYQSPEAEALDKWFEDLQHYEATLEEMAAASLDQSFKEELSAIEQWFRVLSEAERTAALYSLLQQSTQVQIRFFITVLQQMARSDPMTALLSPSNPDKSSMEAQMANAMAKAKLESDMAGLSLKSPAPPMSARLLGTDAANDGAAMLAQQRARLKAQAPQRLSAGMYTGTSKGEASSPMWTQGVGSGQGIGQGIGSARSPRPGMDAGELSPMVGGNWASMVNTPLVPMFTATDKGPGSRSPDVDMASMKLANWQMGRSGLGQPSGVMLDDARKFRRKSGNTPQPGQQGIVIGTYDENGNLIIPQHQRQLSRGSPRSTSPVPPGLWQQGLGSGHLSTSGYDSGHLSDHSDSGRKKKASPKGDEPVDLSQLNDIPGWLRSLRLHKYTPNFEGIKWQEMVKMSDEDLEKRGVAALGARRKLLKVFEQVREQTGTTA